MPRLRSLSFLAETTIEVIGLALWFLIQRMGGIASYYIGAAILLFFLLAEHILSQFAYTGTGISAQEAKRIVTFSILEVVIWVVWLILIDANQPLVALGFFGVFLYVEHQLTYNTKKTREGLRFLNFSNRHLTSSATRRFVFALLVVFTLAEVSGASLWVILVDRGSQLQGLTALVVGSLIEHFIAGRVARIP